jgi:hypothetical protein
MARMERVAVWSLMSGGGGGRDVFNVSCWFCKLLLLKMLVAMAHAVSMQLLVAWRLSSLLAQASKNIIQHKATHVSVPLLLYAFTSYSYLLFCLPCCGHLCNPCCWLCNLQEASLAWEKRQASMRAKLQREEAANAWASWWSSVGGASAGANMYAQVR